MKSQNRIEKALPFKTSPSAKNPMERRKSSLEETYVHGAPLICRIGLLLLLLSGCTGGGHEEGGSASVQLVLKAPPGKQASSKASQAAAPEQIVSAALEVTGPGMSPLSASADLSAGADVRLNLEVPAGAARRFRVTMNDVAGAARFRGEATADLLPETAPQITILMVALNLSIPEPIPSLPIFQISPQTAVVPKGETRQFTASGADPSDVIWSVETGPEGTPLFGRITFDGIYTPPARIPTDGATPIGNPVPVVIHAFNRTDPQIQDAALATPVTGSVIAFEKNLPVTPNPGVISTGSSGQKSIAFFQGKVYAVWSDGRSGIQFADTADGAAWNILPVPGTPGGQPEPVLAMAPDGAVYVAYQGARTNACPRLPCTIFPSIELAVRRPGAGAFELLAPLMIGSQAESPSLAVSAKGIVFAAWSAHGNSGTADILFQRINRDGTLIDPAPRNLTEKNGAFFETRPALSASESGDLFLGWEVSANSREVVATVSRNSGDTFLPEARVNDTGIEFASRPALAAGPEGTVYIAWERDVCNDGCAFLSFDVGRVGSNGLAFGVDREVGSGIKAVRQFRPSIATDGVNGVYIAFHERVSSMGDEIFLAKSRDGKEAFSFSQMSRDDTSLVSIKSAPSVAVDGAGRSFAIWTDNRRSSSVDGDVYFSKGE